MSARRWVAFLLVGCSALPADPASAQVCGLDETVSACYTRLSGASSNAVETAAIAAAEETAKTENAGVDTAAAGTASATKNFIPLLRFAGLVGDGVTTEDGLVAFDVNFPFPSQRKDDAQFQIIVNPSPVLHETLGSALDTLGDAALRDELEDSLSDSDDLRLIFAYGKKGDNLGRDFEQYRMVFASLVEGALSNAKESAADANGPTNEYTDFLNARLGEIRASQPTLLPRTGAVEVIDNLRFNAIDDPVIRSRLMDGVAAEAVKQGNTEAFLGTQVSENQLHRFADLVANQPQLYVSVERRFGSELTGPESTSVDVTWERGLVSIGKFYKAAPEGCQQEQLVATTAAPEPCVAAYKKFVTDNLADIDSAGRSAFSLRYSRVDGYRFTRPLSGLDVQVPSTEKLAASFTFGRKLPATGGNALLGDDSRVDFIVKYEHSDDETVLNSRTITGLTFARKMGDSLMPVTLLYSNKGEVAGDTGSEITVNFGLAFELIR